MHLFNNYPNLRNNIAHISFCNLPTPIYKLDNFGNYLNNNNIYIIILSLLLIISSLRNCIFYHIMIYLTCHLEYLYIAGGGTHET